MCKTNGLLTTRSRSRCHPRHVNDNSQMPPEQVKGAATGRSKSQHLTQQMSSKKVAIGNFVVKLLDPKQRSDKPSYDECSAFALAPPHLNGTLIGEVLARHVDKDSITGDNALEERIESIMTYVRYIIYDCEGKKVPISWHQWVERIVTRALEVALEKSNGRYDSQCIQACLQMITGFQKFLEVPFLGTHQALWFLLGRSSGGMRRRRDAKKLTWFQMLVIAALENATKNKCFINMRSCMRANPEISSEFLQMIKSNVVSEEIKSHIRSCLCAEKSEPFIEVGDQRVSYSDIVAALGDDRDMSNSETHPNSPTMGKRCISEEPPDTDQTTRHRLPEYANPKRAKMDNFPVLSNPSTATAVTPLMPVYGADDKIDMVLWNLMCHEDPQVALGDVKRVTFPWLPPNPPVRTPGKPLFPPRVWTLAEHVVGDFKSAPSFEVDPHFFHTCELTETPHWA